MKIERFLRDRDGYAFVLTMIAMPLLLGFALLIIDASRAANMHTDLQNASDALALAAARELDGGEDAITRADAALAAYVKNQTRLSGSAAVIDQTQVTRHYLDAIPASDDDPIDSDWITNHETTDGTNALYVIVRTNPRSMTTLFPLPVSFANGTVTMQAEAVATYDVSACNVTPLFICNPWEHDTGTTFADQFNSGALYARQMEMKFSPSNNAGPGNFGFLRVGGNGANVLGNALATGSSGACYNKKTIQTEPGANAGQVEPGLNVRFDLYSGPFNKSDKDWNYRPAYDVRKGTKTPNSCSNYAEQIDGTAMALPTGSSPTTFQGGLIYGPSWSTELKSYWTINHPKDVSGTTVNFPIDLKAATNPTGDTSTWPPSRYDIYQYEATHQRRGAVSEPLYAGDRAPNGEHGDPQCYKGDTAVQQSDVDRRNIFAAVVNCTDAALHGSDILPTGDIVGFVSMFLTKPAQTKGPDKIISTEIIDFSGYSGSTSLDTFLRQESFLVR